MTAVCLECKIEVKSYGSLARHIRFTHGMTSVDYAEKFFIQPICQCGAKTKLLNIRKQYDTWCAACQSTRRKQAAIAMRARLKADPIKYEAFISKLSETIGWQWENLDQSKRMETIAKNNPKRTTWHGIIEADNVEEFMTKNNLRAPWSFADLNQVFGV